MKGLTKGAEALNEFLSDEERIRSFTEAMGGLAKAFGLAGKAINKTGDFIRENKAAYDMLTDPEFYAWAFGGKSVGGNALNPLNKINEAAGKRSLPAALEENANREAERIDFMAWATALQDSMSLTNIVNVSNDSVDVDTINGRGQKVRSK